MEQTARVNRILEDGTAEVVQVQESGCAGDCHQCGGCGASHKPMTLLADNPVGARIGDWVTLEARPGAMLKAAAALYVLPLVLFIAGFLLGEHLWQMGVLVSLCGLMAGLVLAKLIDRQMSKKGNVYTITGLAKSHAPNNTEKGDNAC